MYAIIHTSKPVEKHSKKAINSVLPSPAYPLGRDICFPSCALGVSEPGVPALKAGIVTIE